MTRRDSDLPAEVDVLIAGGGPTGLFLALDLSRRGVTSAVVEPRHELDWLRPRAKTTNARTMTHLRRLGLADRLRAAAPLPVSYSDSVTFCTSLVGFELLRFREALQLQQSRYELQPESGQQAPQPVVETVLRQAVEEDERASLILGARYLDSQEIPGGGRVVTVQSSVGEQVVEQKVRCRFLVGADGLASSVRRDLGIQLQGTTATKSNLGLVFRSHELPGVVSLEPAVQYWVVGNEFGAMLGPLDGKDIWWAIVQGYDPELPKFRDLDRKALLCSLIGAEVDIEILAEDPWAARMLLVSSYRNGSAFLAGDAAHSNPPWGGHGFNTGIGDAANLAWKLAADVHGWAGPRLLDSYQVERRPIARRTIDEATANGAVQADDLASHLLTAPGGSGERARSAAGQALQVKRSEFSSLGLVLGYDYAGTPLITAAGGSAPPLDSIGYEPSAAPGCLLPHAWLPDGGSLYDRLGPDFTVLVDEQAVVSGRIDRTALSAVASATPTPIALWEVTLDDDSCERIWQAPLLLVRPDQHVAWRGEDLPTLVAAIDRARGA